MKKVSVAVFSVLLCLACVFVAFGYTDMYNFEQVMVHSVGTLENAAEGLNNTIDFVYDTSIVSPDTVVYVVRFTFEHKGQDYYVDLYKRSEGISIFRQYKLGCTNYDGKITFVAGIPGISEGVVRFYDGDKLLFVGMPLLTWKLRTYYGDYITNYGPIPSLDGWNLL